MWLSSASAWPRADLLPPSLSMGCWHAATTKAYGPNYWEGVEATRTAGAAAGRYTRAKKGQHSWNPGGHSGGWVWTGFYLKGWV